MDLRKHKKTINFHVNSYRIELRPMFDSNGVQTNSFFRTLSDYQDGRLIVIGTINAERERAHGIRVGFQ